MNKNTTNTKIRPLASLICAPLTGIAFFVGLLSTVTGLLPFSLVKAAGDALSKDGNLETLTSAKYAAFHLPLLLVGLTLLIGSVLLLIFRKRAQKWIEGGLVWIVIFGQAAWKDFQVLLRVLWDNHPGRLDGIILGVLLAAAILVRLVFINRAAQYDEVYSFLEFARYSFWQALSDYHIPNNHVLNTLLMRAVYLLFGGDLWVIRLPAFLAGLLLLPAAYGLGRLLYNRWVGLLAAAGAALAPQLILYSTNGRGYTFVCLFTLLIYSLGVIVRGSKNRAAWLLLAVFTALGFFSIPIMLYPFGGLLLWLALTGLLHDFSPQYGSRWSWLRYLTGYILLAGALTGLLYAPIIAHYGPLVFVTGSKVTASSNWTIFLQGLPAVWNEVRGEWGFGVPAWTGGFLLAGLLLSLPLNPRSRGGQVPMSLALAAFIVIELLVHRPVTLGRIWLFLLPMFILWGFAGWGLLVEWASHLIKIDQRFASTNSQTWFAAIFSLAILTGMLVMTAGFLQPYLADPVKVRTLDGADVEQATLFLKNRLQPGDVVVVSYMIDARYWYYFEKYGIPQQTIRAIKSRPFRHVYAVLEPGSFWTVDSLLKDFGPDPNFLKMNTLREINHIGSTRIYDLDVNLRAVQKAYGDLPADWGK